MIRICVLLTILLSASNADAIPRAGTCPKGTAWNMVSGSCAKIVAAPRQSAQEKYARASDDIARTGKNPDPKRGVMLLEQACAERHSASCLLLGVVYGFGRGGIPTDDKKAEGYFAQACQLKDPQGCTYEGSWAVRRGRYDQARKAFAIACDMKHGEGCMRGGDMLARGVGGKKDDVAAAKLYRQAMTLLEPSCPSTGTADANACYFVGYMYETASGTPKDPAKAVAAYRIGCTTGGGAACFEYGSALATGLGVAVDAKAAGAAYERACTEFDHAKACEQTAIRDIEANELTRAVKAATRACELDAQTCGALGHLHGYALPKRDDVASTGYYKQGCDAGDLAWCIKFAIRAHGGLGMTADPKLAVDTLERVCDGGFPEGCQRGAEYLAKVDTTRAIKLATRGCDVYNHAVSCYRVGWIASNDWGAKDEVKAFKFFVQSCDLGFAGSCDLVGNAYASGTGTTKDLPKAYEAYRKSCVGDGAKKFDADGCAHLGRMAYNGQGIAAKDPKAAVAAYVRACNGAATNACTLLVALAIEVNIFEEVGGAIGAACKAQNEDGCVAFANLSVGVGQESDKREGYALLVAACGRKYVPACLRQAELLVAGIGTSKDLAAAAALYRGPCEQGDAAACFGLGSILSEDRSKQDEAQRLLVGACEKEVASACNVVGFRFNTAKGVPWDLAAAAKYYARACELGDSTACANQAILFRFGVGVPQDHKKAFEKAKGACVPPQVAIGCETYAHYLATGEGGASAIDRKAAEKFFRISCDATYVSPEGCRDLAALLEGNKGSAGDIARLRTKAFDVTKTRQDNPYYVWLLGTFHEEGLATMKDPKKAIELYGKACEGYEPLGCIAGGKALRATGNKDDAEKARVYLERACAAGMNDACGGGAKGPTPVVKGKGGCCSGEVAPGAEVGLAIALLVLVRRRRRITRPVPRSRA